MNDIITLNNLASTGEPIISDNIKWDMVHNMNHLYRYVTCKNDSCSNIMHTQDVDAPRHKMEGYTFDTNKFYCQVCGNVAKSELEFCTENQEYVHPTDYTVILSGYDGNERFEDIYKVYATTPRNAYAAAIRGFRNAYSAYGEIALIHIATYVGHITPIKEGMFAYQKSKNT